MTTARISVIRPCWLTVAGLWAAWGLFALLGSPSGAARADNPGEVATGAPGDPVMPPMNGGATQTYLQQRNEPGQWKAASSNFGPSGAVLDVGEVLFLPPGTLGSPPEGKVRGCRQRLLQ